MTSPVLSVHIPFRPVLSVQRGIRIQSDPDAGNRQGFYAIPLLRGASDAQLSEIAGLWSGDQAYPASDAADGADADLSETQNRHPESGRQTLSVPSRSGLVRGYHVYSDEKRFFDLVAIMDWYSRKVLSWRLSNTMDADFCVSALEEALARYGKPDIFNTDQGAQFTSFAFTRILLDASIRISMDGRGRWLDNVFVERLWRSLKYEHVCLHARETGSEARAGIGEWIDFYNRFRPHSGLGGIPPNQYYEQRLLKAA